MIPIDEKKVETLISFFKDEIARQIKAIRKRLQTRLATTTATDRRAYINALLLKGDKLIVSSRSEIANFRAEFNSIKRITTSKSDLQFKDAILDDLGYTNLRTGFYPEYFRKLGIKACVYCNSQLCVTVEDTVGHSVARYQVDHFLPKSEFPCLSIALFNLYPVCASCNNKKGKKKILFELYAERAKTKKSDFLFLILDMETTVAKYLSQRDPSVIKIQFQEPDVPIGTYSLDELFSINGIYNTQVDLVEELIMKRHIYDESYRNVLETSYPKLFDKADRIINRLLVGNYIEPQELHLRPMAKFMQDIARQLELI